MMQAQYCAVPDSGKCPCYNVGDEFMFYRNDERDDYWHMGAGTLIKSGKPDEGVLLSSGTMHCGTDGVPFCSEAWDAISRYIYSTIYINNLAEDIIRDAEAELEEKEKHRKHKMMVNRTLGIGILKNDLIYILLEKDAQKQDKLFQQIL